MNTNLPPSNEFRLATNGTPADESAGDADPEAPLGGRILDELEKYHVPGFMALRVSVWNGVVTLKGEVATPYEKQLVKQICRRIAGVVEVRDRMSVAPPPAADEGWRIGSWLARDDRYDYELPFRARHVGVVTGALALLLVLGVAVHGWTREKRLAVFPTSGQVFIGGRPAAEALLVLHPLDRSIPATIRPTARADTTGRFAFGTYEANDGAPPGDYKVTIVWRKLVGKGEDFQPGPNLAPAALANPDSSSIRVTVDAAETTLPTLNLKGQGRR